MKTPLYLWDIQNRDPDGWETEPTQQDYQNFEEWVVKEYGWSAYQEYMRGGWGEVREV